MSIFKEILRQDIRSAFLNLDEFGEDYAVNGKTMIAIVDNNELLERKIAGAEYQDGMYGRQLLLYVAAEDYGPEPKVGSKITVGKPDKKGRAYIVTNCIDEDGIYSIEMEANRI